MAMSAGGGGGSSEKPLSDINTTPLVDVMLVLLIIFLIAVPVAIQTVKGIVLPKVAFDPTTTKPENVLLSVTTGPDGNCMVYWGTSPITSKDLLTRAVDKLKLEIERQGGAGNPDLELPEVHIRGDVNTPYKCIGGSVYTMQQAGFAKVGFISQPPPAGGAS
ncbi:biopolymer transporter ExbD [Sphingomonadaceae bacterium OTU29MARTA1]|uniref:ExbD/TolR family protein n=1 Tax=Sphingomonas sp. Leaf37 TaxID=2876552 RepID=UPI001E55C64E|nr:biopolymer transporter ExbD [Sphingomonas sp. Leaf37]USU04985.1 biopolymer transporter ExbD [Sphingomonadaceae bacterium OTU29LAMAA1]USU08625.1 biopolymer transporter ExbD [Sphingomonadaceae bacterium OTU29MARTA1]USU12103.1 biopolymer transporter ExbD [Sphingomonadaceae bacterium OTU29THOMA1]